MEMLTSTSYEPPGTLGPEAWNVDQHFTQQIVGGAVMVFLKEEKKGERRKEGRMEKRRKTESSILPHLMLDWS